MAGITIYAQPGVAQEFTLSNAPPGLVAANSIGWRIMDDEGNTVTPRTAVGVIETPGLSGHYSISLTTPATLGTYSVIADVDPAGVLDEGNYATDSLVVQTSLVVQVIPAEPTPGSGPVLGPCQSWITPADIRACCPGLPDGTTFDAFLEQIAIAASQTLYMLSGQQFSGVCEETVRPCTPGGCASWLNLGVGIIPGWGSGGETWGGGVSGGGLPFTGPGWYDYGSDYGTNAICGCQPLSQILLGYPVDQILEVTIDGVVVDPATYRVDEWRYLVRTADVATSPPTPRWWPNCQNMQVNAGDPGSFVVTYTHGVAPPYAGGLAASQLACQMAQQCAGRDCMLPVGTTKVIRQGVQIERGLLASWLKRDASGQTGWQTGLIFVDAFLTAYNPNALRSRPTVWSPDLVKMPRRAGT